MGQGRGSIQALAEPKCHRGTAQPGATAGHHHPRQPLHSKVQVTAPAQPSCARSTLQRHKILPGMGSCWWHVGPTRQHHLVPMCWDRGSVPSIQGSRCVWLLSLLQSPLPPRLGISPPCAGAAAFERSPGFEVGGSGRRRRDHTLLASPGRPVPSPPPAGGGAAGGGTAHGRPVPPGCARSKHRVLEDGRATPSPHP